MTIANVEDLARQAVEGDRRALEQLVTHLQRDVYGLAIRMLWNREDAEDATQEILVRVVTRLAQFDFRSQLRTWVYRIAVNYILDARKSPVERMRLTFDTLGEDLGEGLSNLGPQPVERSLLVEEVKIGCTLAMLQCLDRPHRLAYVLGEIFELSGPEAAEALEISPTLFRKRLQHARSTIVSFTRVYCGLVSESAACACHRRVPAALETGRVRPGTLHFASAASSFEEARAMIQKVEEARRAFAVHHENPPHPSSADIARQLVESFDATRVDR